jgi:hypothetical protein
MLAGGESVARTSSMIIVILVWLVIYLWQPTILIEHRKDIFASEPTTRVPHTCRRTGMWPLPEGQTSMDRNAPSTPRLPHHSSSTNCTVRPLA